MAACGDVLGVPMLEIYNIFHGLSNEIPSIFETLSPGRRIDTGQGAQVASSFPQIGPGSASRSPQSTPTRRYGLGWVRTGAGRLRGGIASDDPADLFHVDRILSNVGQAEIGTNLEAAAHGRQMCIVVTAPLSLNIPPRTRPVGLGVPIVLHVSASLSLQRFRQRFQLVACQWRVTLELATGPAAVTARRFGVKAWQFYPP